jgi:hypothetical protein
METDAVRQPRASDPSHHDGSSKFFACIVKQAFFARVRLEMGQDQLARSGLPRYLARLFGMRVTPIVS